jgi:hypothetical protein
MYVKRNRQGMAAAAQQRRVCGSDGLPWDGPRTSASLGENVVLGDGGKAEGV